MRLIFIVLASFYNLRFVSFVGVAGFEPTTPCSQSRCANRTALHPEEVLFLKSDAKVVL